MLKFDEVSKTYGTSVEVLRQVSFELAEGTTCAIVGPSGSGKSTLLSLAAGLDSVSSGKIVLCGHEISSLSEEQRTAVRRDYLGFVFQSFELIPSLTALENVMVPAELAGDAHAETLALGLLEKVGLSHRKTHVPSQLSGGERQRVALARAFINNPKILFADEPTGNLDRKNTEQINELIFSLNKEHSTTLLIATHDLELAKRCEIVLEFEEQGQLKKAA